MVVGHPLTKKGQLHLPLGVSVSAHLLCLGQREHPFANLLI